MSTVKAVQHQVGNNATDSKNIVLTADVSTGDLVISKGVYDGTLTEISRIMNAGGGAQYVPEGTGAVATTVQAKLRESVSVKDFGAVGNGVADDTAAMQAARDYISTAAYKYRLIFPAGIYSYSVSPNWNFSNCEVVAEGEVRLRYTGTGDAFIIDTFAGIAAYNQTIGGASPFIIEATSSALNGVRIRNSNHSRFNFNVRGCGTLYAGLKVDFAVCSSFTYICSFNETGTGVQGWYTGAKPKYGIYLNSINNTATDPTAYCAFFNPVVEGTQVGVYFDYSLGNMIFGGTAEGCTSQGLLFSANSSNNRVYGTDMEANTVHDIFCSGDGNEFHGIDCSGIAASSQLVTFDSTASRNKIFGGTFGQITLMAGSLDNLVSGASYNRNNDGSTITDPWNSGRLRDIYNIGLGLTTNKPASVTVITIGASPATYTNTSVNDLQIAVSGGTVSSVVYGRTGGALSVGTTGLFHLSPNDYVTITYTVAPTVAIFSV